MKELVHARMAASVKQLGFACVLRGHRLRVREAEKWSGSFLDRKTGVEIESS